MLEKTEGAINKGQYRETGNIGYSRHRTNKTKNTKLTRLPMSPAYLHRSVYKLLSLVPMTEMD